MQVLVINSGSSSVKFELFATRPVRALLKGEVQRIGTPDSTLSIAESDSGPRNLRAVSARTHVEAMRVVLGALESAAAPVDLSDVVAVGHRVVHGGTRFVAPTRIDADVLEGIRELALLAPVHAKANVAGIEAALDVFPEISHVAIFDTAFHRTIPAVAYSYALPRDVARTYGIRRYGFHGTSHASVAKRVAGVLGRPLTELNLITLHLGNGASITALRNGASVDTSMGMTPLEGLVMGTRCGDIDPAIPGLLGELAGESREQVNRTLNFESGLKGMCGQGDMREVHRLADSGDADARLALDAFCYRAKKYVGAYFAILGRVDAVAFTGGIGESDADVRSRICDGLDRLGIVLDPELNLAPLDAESGDRIISAPRAEVKVAVVPTHEELEIAREALAFLGLEDD